MDVLERFLNYVKIDTQSDEESTSFPSTEKQKDLAKLLLKELQELGIEAQMDEKYAYIYAKIPANDGKATKDTIGFIAHMDTSPETSGKNVKPQIHKNYDGKDIVLSKENGYVLEVSKYPEILAYKGQTVITTDGSTLLGADDKAGVAEIMAMADYIVNHPELKHGPIAIGFTPDEEVGAGVDFFEVDRFGANFAYTVDGGGLGELEYENFNAAALKVTVHGVTVHPGSAKGKMKNAATIAMEYNSLLPTYERPEYTEGYEGFFHLTDMKGVTEEAVLSYIIRDHNRTKFEARKQMALAAAASLNDKYGEGTVEVTLKDSYYNMKEKIEDGNMFLIDNARKAMEELGIKPSISPIRGGTDGARLSFMGLPCPNICTGGHNYHGRYEYICADSMYKIVELLVKLAVK